MVASASPRYCTVKSVASVAPIYDPFLLYNSTIFLLFTKADHLSMDIKTDIVHTSHWRPPYGYDSVRLSAQQLLSYSTI